jgi:cellulase/cellobiase CelA1
MSIHGAFLGWSEGTRDCPRRTFSQTEFVVTVTTPFKDWRVDRVPQRGNWLNFHQDGLGLCRLVANAASGSHTLDLEEGLGYVGFSATKIEERASLFQQ